MIINNMRPTGGGVLAKAEADRRLEANVDILLSEIVRLREVVDGVISGRLVRSMDGPYLVDAKTSHLAEKSRNQTESEPADR